MLEYITIEGELHIEIASIVEGEKICSFEEIVKMVGRCGYSICDAQAVVMEKENVGFQLKLKIRAKEMLMFKGKIKILDYMVEQIAAAYEKMGWKVYCVNIDDFCVTDIDWNSIRRVFTINNIGCYLNDLDGKNYYNKVGVEIYNYIVDTPIYYNDSLKIAPENETLFCVDRKHVDYVNRFYPNIHKTYFLPLGGDNEVAGINKNWDERSIDVLFAGCPKVDLNMVNLSEEELEILSEIWNNKDFSTEEILELKIREKYGSIEQENLREKIWENRNIDICLVTYLRERVVKVLVEAGINVTVLGNWSGWECADNPHCKLGGFLTQKEA